MPRVTFVNESITIETAAGERLLDVAARAGVNVFRGMWQGVRCHGTAGWCRRCKVWATPLAPGATSDKTAAETRRFGLGEPVPEAGTMRLACQTVVRGDVEVRTRPGFEVPASTDWRAGDVLGRWRNSRQPGATPVESGD